MQTVAVFWLASALLPGCNTEILEKQAEQIREQEAEIARQRQEINALLAAQKLEEQKRRDCNRAFREHFEKAHDSRDPEKIIALYREGLELCPDDEVARYELGKALAARGRLAEAEKQFEEALKLNPDFLDAKNQLEAVRQNK